VSRTFALLSMELDGVAMPPGDCVTVMQRLFELQEHLTAAQELVTAVRTGARS
jgi:hypothetical protein